MMFVAATIDVAVAMPGHETRKLHDRHIPQRKKARMRKMVQPRLSPEAPLRQSKVVLPLLLLPPRLRDGGEAMPRVHSGEDGVVATASPDWPTCRIR